MAIPVSVSGTSQGKFTYKSATLLNFSSLVVTGADPDFLDGLREGSKSEHPFAAL